MAHVAAWSRRTRPLRRGLPEAAAGAAHGAAVQVEIGRRRGGDLGRATQPCDPQARRLALLTASAAGVVRTAADQAGHRVDGAAAVLGETNPTRTLPHRRGQRRSRPVLDPLVGDMALMRIRRPAARQRLRLQISLIVLIKCIKRVAFGFRNFDNYRVRVLLHCDVKLDMPSTAKIRGRRPAFTT